MDGDIFIGEYLRREREDRGIELKFISQRTKINLNILKKLEASALDELPNRTYVKSFVQHYAREINLNQSEALKVLDYTYDNYEFKNGVKSNKTRLRTNFLEDEAIKHSQKNNQFLNNNKIVITVSVTLLVAVGLIMIIRSTQKSVQVTQNQEVAQPSATEIIQNPELGVTPGMTAIVTQTPVGTMTSKMAPPTPISTILVKLTPTALVTSTPLVTTTATAKPTVTATATAKPTVTATATAKPTVTATATAKPTVTATATAKPTVTATATAKPTVTATASVKKENFPVVEFKKITGELFKPIKDSADIKNPDIVPTNIRNAMTGPKQNVFINSVEADTWVTYKVDNNPVKGFTLGKGRTLFLRGGEIKLFVGNTTGAKVFYNNQLVQFDSKTGVKSLVFPPSEATKYSLPLFIRDKAGKIYTSEEYQEVTKGQ